MTPLGLRIDVDTFRGTREGVPRLLDLLAKHGVTATFVFSLGPDNMGRHLWRLANPRFALKMLRSKAASLYGWDILLAGTLWPGRRIGERLAPILRDVAAAGHEVGLHAWDHHRWQAVALRLSKLALEDELRRGTDAFETIFGRRPDCSAAAGWICNERVLEAKEACGFRYNSDCRGDSIFTPVVAERRLARQVPTTLPTYDEVVGHAGITAADYNDHLLGHLAPDRLNVLAVHAEVEGIICAPLFDAFLKGCCERAFAPTTLGTLLEAHADSHEDTITLGPIAGRAGQVCWQRSALAAVPV